MSRSGSGNRGEKEGEGFHGNGISKAIVDVASPEARSEQAEGGHERVAVCADELIDVGSTQLEGANRLDARNEVCQRRNLHVHRDFNHYQICT
jgi:hypothetical protein